MVCIFDEQGSRKLAQDHKKVTSWASAMELVTFGLAVRKSKKIARKNCAKNARIPALGCGTVQEKDESQEA